MNLRATPRLILSNKQLKLTAAISICFYVFMICAQRDVYGQTFELQEPVPANAQKDVTLAFKILNASDKRLRIKVSTPVDSVVSNEVALPTTGEHILTIRLLKGVNTISVIGFVNDVPTPLGLACVAGVAPCPPPLQVTCNTRWCKEPFSLDSATLIVDSEKSSSEATDEETANANANPKKSGDKPKGLISVTKPEGEGPFRYQDVGEVPIEIRVAQKPDKKDNIENVSITVRNTESGPVNQDQPTLKPKYSEKTSEPAVLDPRVKIKEGKNEVTVFDTKNAKSESVSLNIICEGPNCGQVDFADSVDRFSSLYTRGIVGFEQSGGSAATSVQKPFLEFFWNPPISTSEGQNEPFRFIYPRASLWGSVKFTSVPQQVSTQLATFAPSFLSPINESKVNELVQGFDFLAGVEVGFGRGFSRGDIGTAFLPTGVPDTKQKFSAYFIAGVGAISPLSPKDTVQIFARPSDADLERLGLGKLDPKFTFIAFASPDRDSFFRQYYAGVRIKSHYFHENSIGKFDVVNRPGGMFDVTLGQNEAVTGGRLRGMIIRFDGFYPLPVSDRSILYLYGSALINLRKRADITDPIFLTTAPSNTSFPAENVFVTTSKPSNRDLYRIGIGVNLLELLRGKFTQKPDKK